MTAPTQGKRQTPNDWDQLFPGRFLKSGEMQGRKLTFSIAAVYREELPARGGGTEWINVVTFEPRSPDKPPKELKLNRTNAICFRELFGRKPQEWVGHRVTLYPAPYQSPFGDTAIRVWGSPELETDREITIELPMKKPLAWTLHAVRNGGGQRERQPGEDD